MSYLRELIQKIIDFIMSFFGKKKPKGSKMPQNQSQYLALKVYKAKKSNKNSTPPPRSVEEAYKRSWEFLKGISEKVRSFFSKKDQAKIEQIGKILHQSGLRYKHENKFINQIDRSATREITKEKKSQIQR